MDEGAHGFASSRTSRRALLASAVSGAALLAGLRTSAHARVPATPRPAPAKCVIFLYMPGGPSQLDLFDHKPRLARWHGRTMRFGGTDALRGTLLASPWRFRRHGESGHFVSELLPELAKQIDRLCFLRAVVHDESEHGAARLQLHTGSGTKLRPALGAWCVYGLGRSNVELPGFVTLRPGRAHGGSNNWSNGALPAQCRGVAIDTDGAGGASAIEHESAVTRRLYGLDDPVTAEFGRQCLRARQLTGAGVRFVVCNAPASFDHHEGLRAGHRRSARAVDRPIAGLLADLAGRGALDETLVVWGGEFGRSPLSVSGDGRDHHRVSTMWLAGGGTRAGSSYGATDEYGFEAVDGAVTIGDLHATVLALLGPDAERLRSAGAARDLRPTAENARVTREILAT